MKTSEIFKSLVGIEFPEFVAKLQKFGISTDSPVKATNDKGLFICPNNEKVPFAYFLDIFQRNTETNIRTLADYLSEEGDGMSFKALCESISSEGFLPGSAIQLSWQPQKGDFSLADGWRRSFAFLSVLNKSMDKKLSETLAEGESLVLPKKRLDMLNSIPYVRVQDGLSGKALTGFQLNRAFEGARISIEGFITIIADELRSGSTPEFISTVYGFKSATKNSTFRTVISNCLTAGKEGGAYLLEQIIAGRIAHQIAPKLAKWWIEKGFTEEEKASDFEKLFAIAVSKKKQKIGDVHFEAHINPDTEQVSGDPTEGEDKPTKNSKKSSVTPPDPAKAERAKKITEMVQFLEKESGIDIEEVYLSIQSAYAMAGKAGSIFRAALQTGEVSLLIEGMKTAPNDVVAKAEKILSQKKSDNKSEKA
jgi:hypothetical protein